MRLDIYLHEKGLAKSRSFAKTLITDGFVEVNNIVQNKPSYEVADADVVNVTGCPYEYVGRGGLKLEAALNSFNVSVTGKIAVDIGASTGGFTHCLLLRGSKRVYAVDIGHDQLDKSLCSDERVVNLEGLNARYLKVEDLGEICDIAVSDISFISQTYIIPQISQLLTDEGVYIALIKPQFECGRGGLNKNGVVKDKKTRFEAVKKVINCVFDNGMFVSEIIKSPIEGGDGNTEFLMLCTKNQKTFISDERIKEVCGL